MLQNPTTLIRDLSKIKFKEQMPDAIYIPSLNKVRNINGLLRELAMFNNKITIILSSNDKIDRLRIPRRLDIKIVNYAKMKGLKSIRSLKTFQGVLNKKLINWDLPIKRNLAIIDAMDKEYRNILLIDDDIREIGSSILKKGVQALKKADIVGGLGLGFPDTSVIGHIEQKYGEDYYPFISGNFLFINVEKVSGFFPLIYNEDWMFMIPSILANKVGYVGVVKQKKYAPFQSLEKIAYQEFGEIIAVGLFELISRNNFGDRYNLDFWESYMSYRQDNVRELLGQIDKVHLPFIKKSLECCSKISANNCISFIDDWEEDIFAFNKIKYDGK